MKIKEKVSHYISNLIEEQCQFRFDSVKEELSNLDNRIAKFYRELEIFRREERIIQDYDLVLWWHTDNPTVRHLSYWNSLIYHKDGSVVYYAVERISPSINDLLTADHEQLISMGCSKFIFKEDDPDIFDVINNLGKNDEKENQ